MLGSTPFQRHESTLAGPAFFAVAPQPTDIVILTTRLPTTRSRFTSRLGRENATATLGQTPRPQWLPYQGREVSRR
ncbi:MAG: hypothetical protein ACHBN1_30910 [Heteroscytonema crispum UTEX LB 1556]